MSHADWIRAIRCDEHPVPTKANALGAKGVGESGTSGALGATMNAILDAVRPAGITYLDMPVTPTGCGGRPSMRITAFDSSQALKKPMTLQGLATDNQKFFEPLLLRIDVTMSPPKFSNFGLIASRSLCLLTGAS